MSDAQLEYRVVWQREGFGKRTKLYQTRHGAERHALVLQGRMAEVGERDPNALMCCSGLECGCGGVTNAEDWARRAEGIPPLVFGPVVESREVGAWASVSGGEDT